MVVFDYEYDEDGSIVLIAHNGYKLGDPENCRLFQISPDAPIRCMEEVIPHSSAVGEENLMRNHKCSNNHYYEAPDGQVIYHCPCEMEDHPAHSEKYIHIVQNKNGVHTLACYRMGGDGKPDLNQLNRILSQDEHDLHYKSYDENSHTVYCDCGFEETLSHAITFLYMDEASHLVSCNCGFSYMADHELTYECLNGGWHCVTCICFGTENEPHYPHYETVLLDGKLVAICTACGYSTPL